MARPETHHLRQFLLLVAVLLLPCFALWSFFSAALVSPIIGLAHWILTGWFPDIVHSVYQQGADAILMSRFDEVNGQLVIAGGADTAMGFRENTRILSYSIAFYATLHFATERKHYVADFLWGLLPLYILILLGVLCLCMKDLMVTLGKVFLEQPGVLVPAPDVIGIAYQLSVLMVPTLAPVLVWAWQSRATPLLQGLLGSEQKGIDTTPAP
jgi:hypothetical protein